MSPRKPRTDSDRRRGTPRNADEWGEALRRDIREETHLRFDDSWFPSAPSTALFRRCGEAEAAGQSSRVLLIVRMRSGAQRAFAVSSFAFKDIEIEAKTAGTIANTQDWKMEDMRIKTADGSTVVVK